MTTDVLRALARIHDDGYHRWGPPYQMAPTLEDCEFLYALIRVTKPERVVECGAGMGVSARFIGEALKANGKGGLASYDDAKEWADQARTMVEGLPAFVFNDDSILDHHPGNDPDIVFVDSAPGRREQDIHYWLDHADLVVVHDAMRGYKTLEQAEGALLKGTDGLWIGHG